MPLTERWGWKPGLKHPLGSTITSEAWFSPLATDMMTHQPKHLLLDTLTLTGSIICSTTLVTTTKLPMHLLVHLVVD